MADLNTLVVTIQQRIREQVVPQTEPALASPNQGVDSFGNMLSFLVTTWIDKIVLLMPDGVTEAPSPYVPLELFLYQKMNNVLPETGTPLYESLLAGSFLRCLEPEDIDPDNPTRFGAKEQLLWVKDPWTYTGTDQLMPSCTGGGLQLTLATSEDPYSPLNTKNTTGYYVSRVHVQRTLNPDEASEIFDTMKVAVRAFAAKYNAKLQVVFEQQGSGEWINNGFGT